MENILANRIKSRLKALNMNATQAALLSDLGKTAVRDIIAGKSKSPTVATLGRLATTLKCSVSYLLGDVETPELLSPTNEQIKDIQFANVQWVLRAGIFQKNAAKQKFHGQYLLYSHPSAPEHTLFLTRMGDNSMASVGILEGDIITAAVPYDDREMSLHGRLLVVIRTVPHLDLDEISLREGVATPEGLSLVTRPIDDESDVIRVDRSIEARGTYNLFMSDDEQGVSVHGFVIRVTRDIPEF
ncbi:helix-turn-helix transcriptional regulator [Rhizobium sp. NXC24]|uniref:helix-turn-helix domain-containing protein n=1 Tax=Rhizobium sp. NXC24 TaxID=2048897 RepID=UPI000CDF46D6|nr:helix-turn-helix transcriptional regulator [Rhizobium sp. NXC24]AVA20654.1 helix-turn-helix domain-containing protein [Rhizobium sp. NXC24]